MYNCTYAGANNIRTPGRGIGSEKGRRRWCSQCKWHPQLPMVTYDPSGECQSRCPRARLCGARAAGFAVAACRFACFARRRRGLGLPARRPPSRLQMGGRRGPGRIGAGAQRFWRCGASKDPLAASVVRSRALFSERAVRFRDSTARPHPAGKARGAERTFLPGLTFSSADVRLETGGILVCLYLYESPYVASR